MKKAILMENGFKIIEENIPNISDNEILIKSSGCGICEGDVFTYSTRKNNSHVIDKGLFLGHESSGIIEKVGKNINNFNPGQKVTVLGGGYSEFFTTTSDKIALVPDSVKIAHALGEPIACCLFAAKNFNIELGDRVAIIGAGYMGLNCMQLAKLQGASEVVQLDIIDWRLETARELGADQIVNSTNETPESLLEKLGQFDVVIEATGVQQAIDFGTSLLKFHGTLVLVGYHQSNEGVRKIDMKTWNFKALNVINGHIRDEVTKLISMNAALRLMAHKKINTETLITDYHFNDINKAFENLTARKKGLYKANLIF